jgi:F-type H+-transporting ATPase subunit delta
LPLQRVVKRYCKALFELALEQDQLVTVEKDLERIDEIIGQNKDFTAFFASPIVRESQKTKFLTEIFKDQVSVLTGQFLRLLSEKKRSSLLPLIVQHFWAMLLAYRDIVEVELTSVVDLNNDQLKRIQNNLQEVTGKSVILKKSYDPALIGGFIVKMGDTVIDNSIRNQLNKLHERLTAQ